MFTLFADVPVSFIVLRKYYFKKNDIFEVPIIFEEKLSYEHKTWVFS